MKSFLLIGMGRFGHQMVHAFAKQKDVELMLADVSEDNMSDLLPLVESARIGDCTSEAVLRSFGVGNFDACYVCLASNFETSLEITSMLSELGAARVVSKADSNIHAKFLLRNGANDIMYPEHELAERLAVSESSDSVFECFGLTDDCFIFEISVQDKWVNKTMVELQFRSRYKLSILATKSDGVMNPLPSIEYRFKATDHLIVLGRVEDIRNAEKS